MAVYKRTYKSYDGPLTNPATRFLVLQRYAFRAVFKSRLLGIGYFLCFIPGILMLCVLYLNQNASVLGLIGQKAGVFKINGPFSLTSSVPGRACRNSDGVRRARAGRARSSQWRVISLYEPAIYPRGIHSREGFGHRDAHRSHHAAARRC